ncbi:hypothetical protein [Streptomyces termitum]|uniref:hypothetical protein n=1 Tax=Streptomyces termitum TaxID=67368 RepID=UPI0033B6C764
MAGPELIGGRPPRAKAAPTGSPAPRPHPGADGFDPGRATARSHLASGHGTRFRLGADLARNEIRVPGSP